MSKHEHSNLLSRKELKMQQRTINWEKEKDLIQKKALMKQERKSFRMKPSTTKLIVFFLFLNCTAVEIFTGWATWKSLQISELLGTYADFTPLVTLIGAIVGEVVGLAVYAVKSKAENTEGGVTYLKAQHELGLNNHTIEEESVG